MNNYDEKMDIFPPFLNYPHKKFIEVFPNAESFSSAMPNVYGSYLADINLELVYELLCGRYGESTIAYENDEMFKKQLFRVLFQYGPNWAKELDIQQKLRGLSEVELIKGTTTINDHGYNPSTVVDEENPGPNPEYGEITTTNEQTTTKFRKSKVDAYANLLLVLSNDVTENFLLKFRKLFVTIVCPFPRWDDTDLSM